MSAPDATGFIDNSIIGLLLLPLLAILALDALGRLLGAAWVTLHAPQPSRWLPRLQLVWQFHHSGLRRQLLAHGIKPGHYRRRTAPACLREQLQHCRHCPRARDCLRPQCRRLPALADCPNGEALLLGWT